MDSLTMLSPSQIFSVNSLLAGSGGGGALPLFPRCSCESPSAAATAIAARSSSSSNALQRKYKLLFAKVLLHCIEKSGNTELYQQTKKCISLCIQRNKQHDARFMPLPEVLGALLRELVGEYYWQQAEVMSRYFCRRPHSCSAQRRQQQQHHRLTTALAAQQQRQRIAVVRKLKQQEQLLDVARQSDAVVAELQLLTAALKN